MDNGKVATGMDESVPTVDFPLRQEVLESPEIKQAIDNFKQAHAQIEQTIEAKWQEVGKQAEFLGEYDGSKEAIAMEHAALEKLTNELDQLQQSRNDLEAQFGEGMKQLGIRNPSDAIGLNRPLYESVSRPKRKYFYEGRKIVGGETTYGSPGELAIPIKKTHDARNKWGKQSGRIHTDLLTFGVPALIKKLGNFGALMKFNGTFTTSSLMRALGEAFDIKSKETLVWMKPEDFLNTAIWRKAPRGKSSIEKRASVREGLNTEEGLRDIPFLIYRNGVIDGHEGRHRNDVFVENGLELIPVRIIRYDGTRNNTPLPKQVVSQRGDLIDLPEPIFTPKEDGTVTTAMGEQFSQRQLQALAEVISEDRGFPKTFGNSQRGSVTIEGLLTIATAGAYPIVKAVSKAVKSALDSKSVLAEDLKKQEVFNKATKSDVFIGTGPDVETVKTMLKGEEDIKSPKDNFYSGSEMFAAFKNSAAIAASAIWTRAAKKLAELKDRQEIRPLEEAIQALFRSKEAEKVHETLVAEMLNDTRLTPDELARLKFTEEQMNVYNEFRRLFDEVYELQRSKMSPEDAAKFTHRDAYLASSWKGDWGAPVYKLTGKTDANGKPEKHLVAWVRDTSKYKAEQAIKKMLAAEEGLVADRVDFKKGIGNSEEGVLVQSYSKLVQILGKDDPVVQRLSDILAEHYSGEGKNVYGQGKHFKPKTGVRGFEGDRADRSKTRNAEDLFNTQIAYLRNAYQWAYMQDAMDKIKGVLSDPELQDTHPNTLAWMREDARNVMGFGTNKVIQKVENGLSKWFSETLDAPTEHFINKMFGLAGKENPGISTDMGSVSRGIGNAKSLFFSMVLGGFNIPYMAVSMTQPIFSMPHHLQLSLDGYDHNPVRTMVDGTTWAATALLYHNHIRRGNYAVADKMLQGMPKEVVEAIHYIEANGIIDLNQYAEIGDLNKNPMVKGVEELMGLGISIPEMLTRSAAFMSFVSHLEQSGKFSNRLELLKKAEDLSNIVMGNYKHFERAGIFRKSGVMGSVAGTLQTYPMNHLNQLALLAKRVDWKNPKTALPLANLMALQFAFGGLLGYYGIETADNLNEWMKKWAIDLFGSIPPWWQNMNIKKKVLDDLPTWVSYGGLSEMTGLNFSSRMNMGTIPGAGDNALIPFLSFYSNAAEKAIKWVKDPSSVSARDSLILAVSPASTRGLLEANLPTFGDKARIKRDPEGPFLHQRDEADMSALKFGFKTLNESKTLDTEYMSSRQDVVRSANLRGIGEKVEKAIRAGTPEKVDEFIADYIDAGGDPNALIRGMDKRLQATYMSKMQILGQRAKSPASWIRYQERAKNAR
jgi:hypothetical protein